jgi:TPR repeat protein
MRISGYFLSVAVFGFGLGLTTAYAFDGTRSPANIAPAVGRVPPQEVPDSGNHEAVRMLLEDAARRGDVSATWKLGRMYADGDGVEQSDLRAFDYFRTLADSHADETPGVGPAVLVANAFVALGGYYLTGIPNSDVKPDPVHAYEMFNYAASYFWDPDARYRLGRMYLDGQGMAKDSKQGIRWLSLAADQGQYHAQAVLGALLFKGEYVPRDAVRGLMWLMLARDAASSEETWIADSYTAALKQATAKDLTGAVDLAALWTRGGDGEQSALEVTPDCRATRPPRDARHLGLRRRHATASHRLWLPSRSGRELCQPGDPDA